MNIKTYIVTSSEELGKLILDEYGYDYNIPYYMELQNDICIELTVCGLVEDCQRIYINDFIQNKGESWECGLLEALLNDLCLKGKLEAGEYLIRISY